MYRKILIQITALSLYAIALPSAAIAPIVSQSETDEAESITVSIYNKRGHAVAKGCSRCPIKTDIDAGTRFFLKGKNVPRNKAQQLSGESGTIIYSDERVIKIYWGTGELR